VLESFLKGDKVVYPKYGVGFIEKIESMTFQEESFDALHITLKATGVKITLPLDKVDEVGLRHIDSIKNLEAIFSEISCGKDCPELLEQKTWKDRKKVLNDLFASGKLEDLTYIVKYLYDKNQQKILPNSERRVYDFSLKFLIHEIVEIKSISEEEAEDFIAHHLV
jgi:CarD family transcriptional regulator